jgi:4-amino-4-deoxy-L-arabinose transferase-like glycosyltransferase
MLVMVVLGLLRMVFSAIFPLSSDEAYHWEWSRHLALGYYDHPPMTAYVIFIFTSIFGNNEMGVRFGAIVLMTIASIVMFKLGKDMSGDDRVGFWSGLLVSILPILNVFFVYMSTDPPAIFFWALMLWLVYRAVFRERRHYWYLLGLALGGALMTKFLSVLFIPAVAIFVLCSRKYRGLILAKEPYIAGAIALIVLSPFIYWNATHGWTTFAFNLSRRQAIDVDPLHFIEYVGGQALVVSPLVLTGFVYFVVYCWRKGLSERNDLHLFLAATSSVVFAFFLVLSFVRSISAHWPASGYLTLCVGLPYLALKEGNQLMQKHGRKAIALAVAILGAAYLLLFVAYYAPNPTVDLLGRFGGGSEELYELQGWREIGELAERRANEEDAILISPSYAFCSMLSFYTPSQLQLHMFGRGAIHGLNYRFWDGDYSEYLGRNALWVYKERPKEDDWWAMGLSFEELNGPDEVRLEINGRTARKFYFVLCRNLKEYRTEP